MGNRGQARRLTPGRCGASRCRRKPATTSRTALTEPGICVDRRTLDIGNEIAIGALRGGRTPIVVAHRPQTIMTTDQIVMFDGAGGIRETGTYAELFAVPG